MPQLKNTVTHSLVKVTDAKRQYKATDYPTGTVATTPSFETSRVFDYWMVVGNGSTMINHRWVSLNTGWFSSAGAGESFLGESATVLLTGTEVTIQVGLPE